MTRWLLLAIALSLNSLSAAAQTVTTPVIVRADPVFTGSASVTWPALYDSSRVAVTNCAQVRRAGVTATPVCKSKTGPWVRHLVAPPPAPTLTSFVLTPLATSVLTGGTAQFGVGVVWSDGSTVLPSLLWSATGGTISAGGQFTAGGMAGVFQVIAAALGKADTSTVTITAPPPPPAPPPSPPPSPPPPAGSVPNYPYTGPDRIAGRDFRDYASTADMKAKGIGVGCYANECATGLPLVNPANLSALVNDSLFGRVLRYYGDPANNFADTLHVETRVATTSVNFTTLATSDQRRWVWVRFYMRFSINWWPVGRYPKAADSYKGGFLAWDGAGFRLHFPCWSSAPRLCIESGQAIPSGGSPDATTIVKVENVAQDGFGYVINTYFPGLTRTSLSTPGTSDWYEFVIGHHELQRTGPAKVVWSFAWRRITVNGAIAPAAWFYRHATNTWVDASKSLVPASAFLLGQNRNRTFDETMWWDWGPIDVVLGSVGNPNPFNVPGVP